MDVHVIAHKMVEDTDAEAAPDGEPVMICQACGLSPCPIVTSNEVLARLRLPRHAQGV